MPWPDDVFDLVFFPRRDDKLDDLAAVAEPEEWGYRHVTTSYNKPVLFNYLKYTYPHRSKTLAITRNVVILAEIRTICEFAAKTA